MSDQDKQHKAAVIIQRNVRGLLVRSQHKKFVHNLKSRKYVANEILSSERSYVKSLNTIVNVFYKPLKQSKVVDVSVIKCIFGNITEIQGIHVNLLKEMGAQHLHLGSLFAKTMPSFRAYRSYVANYTTSLTSFNAWLEKRSFEDRVKACCGKTGLQPSDLPGLLNLPVTQFARYKLLLEDLLNNTNPQNEDYNDCQKAVALLKLVEEGGNLPGTESDASSSSSSGASEQSLQSTSSSASLARKIHAISQTPLNVPFTTNTMTSSSVNRFGFRSVSATPVTASPNYDGDSSLPSYLRPTHTSYARSNEGRAKKDQVAYTINNTPTWMPNGNAHSEKIYNTPYNAIPYTPRQNEGLDRTNSSSGKTWLPSPATPRAFEDSIIRSASALSVREVEKSPSKQKLFNSSLTASSMRKLIPESPTKTQTTNPNTTPRKTPSSSSMTTPTKSTNRATPSTTPSKTPSSTPRVQTTPSKSSSSNLTPYKPSMFPATPSKSGTPQTTPSKTITAARAAGSNLPVPKTTPAKSGTPQTTPSKPGNMTKTPSQNGQSSKIPLPRSSSKSSVSESTPALEGDGADDVEFDYVLNNAGNDVAIDEDDEMMTF